MLPGEEPMDRSLKLASALGGVVYVLCSPVVAALVLARLVATAGWAEGLSATGWVIAAPVLYLAWLILMLAASSAETHFYHLVGYRKPRRLDTDDGLYSWALLIVTLGHYLRGFLINTLPAVHYLQMLPILRALVFGAYGSRPRLGHDSMIFGFLYDPDLIRIGNGAMIGGGVRISAHSVVPSPRGGWIYNSAPIAIGPRTVIGGEARVGLGVTIGADCIVEPGSFVVAFTTIPDGEVWGGSPAAYVRKRIEELGESADDASRPSLRANSLPCELDPAVRRIVADALRRPLAEIPPDLSTDSCAAWDSLAQMAILAMLHNRFGVEPSAEEGWRLRSIPRIVHYLKSARRTRDQIPVPIKPPHNPELLPLLDHDLATQALAEREQRENAPAETPELPIVIAATFTAEPLAATFALWSRAFGIPVRAEFAAFNQVQQTLLAPESPFYRNATGFNVVLVRPEDLHSGPGEIAETAVDELLDACAQFAARRPGALAVATLPPAVSSVVAFDRNALERSRTHWRERLLRLPGVEVLEFGAIVEQVGIDAARRNDLEVAARCPYSAKLYQELGIELARLARRRRKAAAKVLALDADQVLWGGVIAEDGLEGIALGPDHPGRSFQLFQEQVLKLKRRGVLLVLVSRNNPEDVWQVLDHHPGMLLHRGDFVAMRINWLAKSENLRGLARELNLGLDAFVFVDDDPAIRMEVEASAPEITVVPLPADPAHYCQTLSRLWCFDSGEATAEDASRTEMMRQEGERQKYRETDVDIKSYLHSLGLVVRMRRASAADLPRIAQLTQKTNQFNLSLKRRSIAEIQGLDRTSTIYAVEASDRFGDYGLVGVSILSSHPVHRNLFELDTFLLSCRALGRGVEESALYGIAEEIKSHGGQRLRAPFVPGPRNHPVKEFLLRAGFEQVEEDLFESSSIDRFTLPDHVTWAGAAVSPVKLAG
jgi:FkbH-like protein